jgi:hypothetical protein
VTGVTAEDPWVAVREISIDPATGRLLADQDVIRSSTVLPAGTVDFSIAVTGAGWTDETPPASPSAQCPVGA